MVLKKKIVLWLWNRKNGTICIKCSKSKLKFYKSAFSKISCKKRPTIPDMKSIINIDFNAKDQDPTVWNGSRSYATCLESFCDYHYNEWCQYRKKKKECFKAFTHAAMNLSTSLLCLILLTAQRNRSVNFIISLKRMTGYQFWPGAWFHREISVDFIYSAICMRYDKMTITIYWCINMIIIC